MATHGPTYIYSGAGAWAVSVDQTQQMLETALDSRGIKRFEGSIDLEKGTRLVVIPGGHVPSMFSSINRAAKKIIQFVTEGGKFLGICAGGILATETVISKSRGLISEDENITALYRQGRLYSSAFRWKNEFPDALSFYPGNCVAPHIIKDREDFAHPKNLCAVEVYSDEGSAFKACHYSGPAFLEPSRDTKVLLRYRDPIHLQKLESEGRSLKLAKERIDEERPIAALSHPYGRGRVVLSGIHPEIGPSVLQELKASEPARKEFVSKMFTELSI